MWILQILINLFLSNKIVLKFKNIEIIISYSSVWTVNIKTFWLFT